MKFVTVTAKDPTCDRQAEALEKIMNWEIKKALENFFLYGVFDPFSTEQKLLDSGKQQA